MSNQFGIPDSLHKLEYKTDAKRYDLLSLMKEKEGYDPLNLGYAPLTEKQIQLYCYLKMYSGAKMFDKGFKDGIENFQTLIDRKLVYYSTKKRVFAYHPFEIKNKHPEFKSNYEGLDETAHRQQVNLARGLA